MLDGREQSSDRVQIGRVAQVLCRDMQIDLRAGDLSMTQEIANRDEPDTGAHEVRRERMA